jgi:hypothetical protein
MKWGADKVDRRNPACGGLGGLRERG